MVDWHTFRVRETGGLPWRLPNRVVSRLTGQSDSAAKRKSCRDCSPERRQRRPVTRAATAPALCRSSSTRTAWSWRLG